MRRWLIVVALMLWLLPAGLARADARSVRTAQALAALTAAAPQEFASADPAHDVVLARRTRGMADAAATALPSLRPVARDLHDTRVKLQPWPIPMDVTAAFARARRALPATPAVRDPNAVVRALLDDMRAADAAGRPTEARFARAGAYAIFARTTGRRLTVVDPALQRELAAAFWAGPRGLADAGRVQDGLDSAAQALGDVHVRRSVIVTEAAVIVFREGLEAVLILAAITASLVAAKAHLRRPVFLGALAGLATTAVTWALVETLVAALGDGGLRLQAITGLLAIAVLLLVTNWFFHRIYWSGWIARFNRRRKLLESVDRTGIVSGQVLGMFILGLTSIYREGFETVLFVQSLQASAGVATTLLGIGIGLAGTAGVGVVMFALGRKLPYRRMLIATGVLIALVLAVMVGTTVHNLQAIGWLSAHPTAWRTPGWATVWLGLFGTWEGLGAQLGAMVFVVGSYVVARELQVGRRRRRARATARLGADADVPA